MQGLIFVRFGCLSAGLCLFRKKCIGLFVVGNLLNCRNMGIEKVIVCFQVKHCIVDLFSVPPKPAILFNQDKSSLYLVSVVW